jgi:hypothetical protein
MPSAQQQHLTQLTRANADLIANLRELEELRALVNEAELFAQTSERASRRKQSKPKLLDHRSQRRAR